MICYIGIGSNLGDRKKNIAQAIQLLKKDKRISLIKKSRIYETEPLGGPQQGKFLNGVLEIKTEYSPQELLLKLKEIEFVLGRRKTEVRWAPRPIDLDILFYGQSIIKKTNLNIPHPEIKNRIFVLKPLAEIATDFKHPVFKKTVKELLKEYESQFKNLGLNA